MPSKSSVIDPPTTGLADVVAQIAQESRWRTQRKTEFDRQEAAAARRVADLEHQRDLLTASSLTSEQIALARSVVCVRGNVSEQAEGAFAAAVSAVATGGSALLYEAIGAKRYEGFHQRCDCRYGYGPSHGSIVFAVELTREVRDRHVLEDEDGPLNPAERDAAVAYLLAEKALSDRRPR